jgi:hypothetical protein
MRLRAWGRRNSPGIPDFRALRVRPPRNHGWILRRSTGVEGVAAASVVSSLAQKKPLPRVDLREQTHPNSPYFGSSHSSFAPEAQPSWTRIGAVSHGGDGAGIRSGTVNAGMVKPRALQTACRRRQFAGRQSYCGTQHQCCWSKQYRPERVPACTEFALIRQTRSCRRGG